MRERAIKFLVERFDLDEVMTRRRVNIFLTLVPLSEAQIGAIMAKLDDDVTVEAAEHRAASLRIRMRSPVVS